MEEYPILATWDEVASMDTTSACGRADSTTSNALTLNEIADSSFGVAVADVQGESVPSLFLSFGGGDLFNHALTKAQI